MVALTEGVSERPAPLARAPAVALPGEQTGGGAPVAIRGLRKAFGALDVLRGVTLDFRPGDFIAVVGRSGCGKSTLLRLLAGLERPDDGEIAINGRSVTAGKGITRLMFQDARLLPWQRVLGNVGLGLTGDWRPIARAALREVGLEGRADDWPAVGVAVWMRREGEAIVEARIAVGGATDHPTRMTTAEEAIMGNEPDAKKFAAAGDAAAAEVEPLGDLRGSGPYKREMVRVHVRRALERASAPPEERS